MVLTSYSWFDLGPLWFEDSLGDLKPLGPGYISSYNYLKILLFHMGNWWIRPFECWETTKPSYYDWLGGVSLNMMMPTSPVAVLQ